MNDQNTNQVKTHQKLLEIMDCIHSFCQSNGINYYLIGGSALGAVRHHGFIPWDIDIDIAMLRKDYILFKEKFIACNHEHFKYHDHMNTKNFSSGHARVEADNCFIYLSPDYYLHPKKESVLVDILPLDSAPDNEHKRIVQAKKIQILNKIISRKQCIIYKNNTLCEIVIKKAIKMILKVVPMRYVEQKQQMIMMQYNDIPTKCVCSMASHYSYSKLCMPGEIYGKPQLASFEGRYYYIPERIHEYLTRIFGDDYMQLPPIENRYRPSENIVKFEQIN